MHPYPIWPHYDLKQQKFHHNLTAEIYLTIMIYNILRVLFFYVVKQHKQCINIWYKKGSVRYLSYDLLFYEVNKHKHLRSILWNILSLLKNCDVWYESIRKCKQTGKGRQSYHRYNSIYLHDDMRFAWHLTFFLYFLENLENLSICAFSVSTYSVYYKMLYK